MNYDESNYLDIFYFYVDKLMYTSAIENIVQALNGGHNIYELYNKELNRFYVSVINKNGIAYSIWNEYFYLKNERYYLKSKHRCFNSYEVYFKPDVVGFKVFYNNKRWH